jgi:hypothetical protein
VIEEEGEEEIQEEEEEAQITDAEVRWVMIPVINVAGRSKVELNFFFFFERMAVNTWL